MKIDFGVGFGQELGANDIAVHARAADEAGFTHATYIDMGNLAPEVSVMLSVMAMHTNRMHIGQGVTDPITYSPAVIANIGATLRELSNDRAFIGIGLGGPWGKPFLRPARVEELARAIRFIHAYTAGMEASVLDHSWHSEWIRRSPYNGKPIPVYVSADGPKMCHLAGELADAVFCPGADPHLLAWRREGIVRGALAAGRDPSAIKLWVRTQIYVADSKADAYREIAPFAATNAFGLYRLIDINRKSPHVQDLATRLERHHPGLLQELKTIHDVWDPYYTERMGGPQDKATSQRVVDFFIIVGTADEVCERIEKLGEVGFSGMWPVLYSIQDQMGMLREIASSLIPKFRSVVTSA